MFAFLPLLALASAAASDPPLALAEPEEVAAAVQSCSRAVVGRTKVDQATLAADGWKAAEAEGIFITRRKPGNAAIIMANHGRATQLPETIFQDVCFVRARVRTAGDLKAVADRVTQLSGIEPSVRERRPDTWRWKGVATWIAMDPSDSSDNGTPITQIMVMPSLAAWLRLNPNASSQNKNQEPR